MTTENVAPDVMEAEVDAWHVEAQRRYIQRDVADRDGWGICPGRYSKQRLAAGRQQSLLVFMNMPHL